MLQAMLFSQSHAEATSNAFAHINEVISTPTVGIEDTINTLNSVPSNDVASLIESLLLLCWYRLKFLYFNQ